MSLPLVLSPQAVRDTNKAKVYYAAISIPLALAFVDELSTTLRFIQEHPKGGVLIRRSIRQFPVERFPYVVVYAIHRDMIRIVRVFHTRRNPTRKLRAEG
jgi:toxin ParE1/3/4